MEMLAETDTSAATDPTMAAPASSEVALPADHDRAQVKKIQASVLSDRTFHKKAFERMRNDMFVVKHGRIRDYPETSYKANLAGRHVKTKTAALYAKNPKATARRRETLDFTVWDENPQSLMQAFQVLQQAQKMLAAAGTDPATGEPAAAAMIPPEAEQAFEQAKAVIADYQQGMARRMEVNKIGKTLEILFAQAMREQKPVDFKTGMKSLVRRACTTGVGYAKLGFQRDMGPRPMAAEQLADARARIDHLQRLSQEAENGEIQADDAERAELEASVQALMNEPEIVLREGLIVDFPQATRVIPDQLCTSLVGFIGARHVTVEYLFTPEEVEEMFKVELGKKFKGYSQSGKTADGVSDVNMVQDADDEDGPRDTSGQGNGLVCVWEYYDKPSGLVSYVADGFEDFLRAPAAPDVFVEDFWPLYALTFNAVESENELFPPSDVYLMLDQQMEYNRSRQGMREHRKAARPRWAYLKGRLDDGDIVALKNAEPFEVVAINGDGTAKISDILEGIPVPGVDPNLYETAQLFTDIQMTVGSSEAQFGGTAKATATESAIAANSSASADGSSVDDLDGFLTMLARAAGQILLKEMSEEQVKLVAGPGAVWPHMSLADIASEVFLEVEAGSSGKPNQAIEMANWEKMLPFLIQMPGINPHWMAKETLRRLDDRMDLTEALSEGIPSIVMQNSMKQPGTGDPASDPAAQGGEGGNNGPPAPGGSGGSGPAFGSNQV